MTSIDDLFKRPNIPGKRKLDISHDPDLYYKSAKTTANGDAKGKNHAEVEDVDEEDAEAGPTLPPDEEDSYGPDDDEEGRFFGGGVDKGTRQAMEFLDRRDAEETFVEEKYDVAWLRKLGLNFEKRISKNAELRARYEDEPQKFMVSEADLDADIKALSILSEHPELYAEFAKLGCMTSLVSLLAHENADIAIDAIEMLSELIDEDVQASEVQWNALVDSALEADLLSLVASSLRRFDEEQEADRSGVYHCLSILESLASLPPLAEKVCQEEKILSWLLDRIQKGELNFTQNKQYAAEILSILVQTSTSNRQVLTEHNAVDILLQLIAPYRRRDPDKDSEEEEYVENVFSTLNCLVDEVSGKSKFIESEGVELVLIMLREGKLSKARALRLLDHAVGGFSGSEVCDKLVDALGLKTLFSLFMKKQDPETTEHLLGIFAALLRNLPGDSKSRIRTLAKFMEKDYEKVTKLISLRRDYATKVAAADEQIKAERRTVAADDLEEMEVEWLTRRLDAGLFCLQSIDVVLAWLAVEDGGAKRKIVGLLKDRDEGLGDVKATLQEQFQGVVDEGEDAQNLKDMLRTLVEFL